MALIIPTGSTDWRRVRDIGEVNIDLTDAIQATDTRTKKAVVLKQYDWGSCIHVTLKFRGSTDVDFTGDSIFATFSVNSKIFEPKRVIQYSDGTPIEVLCRTLENGKTEIILPKEVMMEVGNIDMELVVCEANEYRITSPTVKFKIDKSIQEVTAIPPVATANYIVDDSGNHIIWN